jgi:ribA/ribD-fused uncharacterized protein
MRGRQDADHEVKYRMMVSIETEKYVRKIMIFGTKQEERLMLSRKDPNHPLASYSKHAIQLDGAEWPSVEHYYQAMKFEEAGYQEKIRNTPHPADAAKLGESKQHGRRKDWDKVKATYMTRGIYTKCRTYPEVAQVLLDSGEITIMESSQYDYYWGCGRDTRGHNTYGKVLMAVRDKLREEPAS